MSDTPTLKLSKMSVQHYLRLFKKLLIISEVLSQKKCHHLEVGTTNSNMRCGSRGFKKGREKISKCSILGLNYHLGHNMSNLLG